MADATQREERVPASPPGAALTVTIIIKALNEERRIAACIESAFAGLNDLGGEVILADSGSTDRTLEIAGRYPVHIVQLADPSIRRCGIGPQLGFQFARGRFVYILDGDMELDRGFLEAAIGEFERNPELAGVAGLVEEASAANAQFRSRKARAHEGRPGAARWLDMGGLYRADALRDVGYMSNRNLHACEEQELGLRLSAAGWQLKRLPVTGVRHHGHADDTFALQLKRLRSGYLYGPGEVLRASLGKPWFGTVAWAHKHLLATLALCLLFVIGLVTLSVSSIALLVWAGLVSALVVQRFVRRGSLRDALAVTLLWHINALAMARGFFTLQTDPTARIDAVVVSNGDAATNPAGRLSSDPAGDLRPPRTAHHAG